jgi:hypothetical protein
VLAELLRELPDRRRLPRAVDADNEDDGGVRRDVEGGRTAEDALDLLGQRLLEAPDRATHLQPAYELGGRLDADVASDQRLLEPLPGRVVAGIEGCSRELLLESAAALRERLAHPGEEPAPLGLVRARRLVTEQLGPGEAHGVSLRGSYAATCRSRGRRLETICDTPSPPIVTP